MKIFKGYTFIFVILLPVLTEGANIMFFLGISSYSHRMGVWPLAEKLAERGHSVTFVSPFTAKKPNPKINDIVPKALKAWVESTSAEDNGNFFEHRVKGIYEYEWFYIFGLGFDMCKALLNDADYVDWVNSSQFDLIIVDALSNECAYGMAYKFKAKLILFATAAPYPWAPGIFGYPDEGSWIPDMAFHYPVEMNFYHRFVSTVLPLYYKYLREVEYFPKLERLVSQKLGIENLPSFSEIETNIISLLLTNQHYGEDYARPFSPNVIPVGGMHIDENPGYISKELEEFINSGESGFIYLSFGSYVDFSTFPTKTQNVFLNTLKKFENMRFIWKLELNRTADFGDNIFTTKWLNQQALLAHPKIRAFITHGGLYGIQEALCHSVPMIAIPIFAEQDYNAEKLGHRQYGIHLEITTVTEEILEDAITKILKDDRYAKNVARASRAFMDRPERPVDTAVWWTEFVLRHENTSFLRPSSVYQSWWKKRQLDVWGIVFLICLISIRLTFWILKFLLSLIFVSNKGSAKLKTS